MSRESGDQITLEEGADALRELSKQGITTKLLNTHGAVIFRGVRDPSPHAFSVLVHAAEEGRGHKPYDQLGLAGSRTVHDKEVFSASEAPPHLWIHQHNEYSRYTKFPSNIHFFCHKAAEEGGESPFAHSAEFYDRMEAELPQFVHDLATKKLISPDVYRAPGKEAENFSFTWAGPLAFGRDIKEDDDMATKKAKAEIQAKRLTPYFWWIEDDQLEVHQHVEGISRHPATKKPVWFNSMAGRYGTALDRGATDPPYIGDDGMAFPPATYRDGSPIPKDYLHRMWEISTEILVKVKTEPGDMALVDNYQVSHGRVPWSKGERKILVSMWDTEDPKEKILPY
jgi:alpha-ketoglutarate-dependent taurine dioxygenase